MFSTLKQRILLGVYIFIVLSIPVGAYLASQSQTTKSSASEGKKNIIVKATPLPTTSPAKEILSQSEANLEASPSPTPEPSTSTIATSLGPTLALKTTIEGRPTNNQSTKLFVGILEGELSSNPKFLLSFTVDLPTSGEYSNLSLAGLNPGTQYTVLIKGSSQIATSSSFVMSPNVSNINEGQPLNMLTGDLNEDNIIDSADLAIIQATLGSTPSSSNWNAVADFNLDGVVNIFDLALVSKNIGQIGASGTRTSPIPKTATPSASLDESKAIGSPTGGYWVWIPK